MTPADVTAEQLARPLISESVAAFLRARSEHEKREAEARDARDRTAMALRGRVDALQDLRDAYAMRYMGYKPGTLPGDDVLFEGKFIRYEHLVIDLETGNVIEPKRVEYIP